jgi:cell division septal protein FtsQ
MLNSQRKSRRRQQKYKLYIRKIQVLFRYLILVLALVGLFGWAYHFVFRSDYFKVDAVEISGTQSFVNQTDLQEVVRNKVEGAIIFKVKNRELEQTLKDNFQGAKSIKVKKLYPSTISIEVFERVPLALVYNDPSGDLYMVDDEGYVLGIVEEGKTNLSRIRYEGDIGVGLFVDKQMVPIYLELIGALNEEKVYASSMSFSQTYITIYFPEGIELFIGKDKDKLSSVQTAAALLKQLQLEGKKVKKIDLRYDKVIVLYD